MRCFWFGQAVILVGICVATAGIALLCRPSRDTRFTAGVILIALGAVSLLLSLESIMGTVCGHAKSVCQMGTEPAVRLAGGLVCLVGIVLVVGSTLKVKVYNQS